MGSSLQNMYTCVCAWEAPVFYATQIFIIYKGVRIAISENKARGGCEVAQLPEILAKVHDPEISVSSVSPMHGLLQADVYVCKGT